MENSKSWAFPLSNLHHADNLLEILIDDFILGGISTPFDDVKKHFLVTNDGGSIIFKHADKVFVPILSKTKRRKEENDGVLHWWCICMNFAQPRVDVLDPMSFIVDAENENYVQQLIASVLSARSMINNKAYDQSAFTRGGVNGISNGTILDDILSSGLQIMKWFEDWNGLYESGRFEYESLMDFKKWMLADMVINRENKQLLLNLRIGLFAYWISTYWISN